MQKDTYYVTTPLYYTNGTPHIGHAYSTIAADVLARFHRVTGNGRAHFLTGTDEHGQRIADVAAAAQKTPKEFCDEIVGRWKEQWRELDIAYDQFIRTTDPDHEAAVQRIFAMLRERGDIGPGKYEGWYCRNDETFWPASKLIDGKCPNPECGRPVEWVSEDAWFFKMSRYRDRLLDHFRSKPHWVRPQSAWNEMMAILESGLEDLCVSRTSVEWGIPLPQGGGTIYVWFDAICNYITAAGYPHDMVRVARLWPADVHLIGKEILRFHTIIWPAILMALDLPLPELVFANGWITTQGRKMSKSVGNITRPGELIDVFSVDSVRYALLSQAPFGSDFTLSEEGLVRRHNADLANDLGNLVQRSLSMLARYRQGAVPGRPQRSGLAAGFETLPASVKSALDVLDFRGCLATIWESVGVLNRYVEETKPWVLDKSGDAAALDAALYEVCEGIRWIAALIYPFMPTTAGAIWQALGQEGVPGQMWEESLRWGVLLPQTITNVPAPLFPRIEAAAAAG
ncbi:MAG: methionine--tRNA ligase [Candidatus Eremiobacteraeota bacterium]|nr:methionine--tRNA ligase [Candidatus Eremiobacteraeota bacterium]MBC5827801.1 methionine--tRNA ligase [Candidatus Eremiobacteraeota bacterium]